MAENDEKWPIRKKNGREGGKMVEKDEKGQRRMTNGREG